MAAGISDFIASKRRESCLAHASCPIAESVKRDLLVSPGSASFLFDQPLLEKVVTSVKEDSIISSTASLVSLSKALFVALGFLTSWPFRLPQAVCFACTRGVL